MFGERWDHPWGSISGWRVEEFKHGRIAILLDAQERTRRIGTKLLRGGELRSRVVETMSRTKFFVIKSSRR